MSLQTRILLLVTTLLVVTVIGTVGVLTWTTRQALLDQTKADGEIIAGLLTRSASFANQVPSEVEDAIGDQMIVGATITSHLIAIAEASGMSPDEIIAMLQGIADDTVLAEFWITDERGHAYLTTETDIDFTFSPDPREQPQASAFWPLLTGEEDVVVQQAQKREVDDGVFKYVGVGGTDKPRIIQLGTSAELLDDLAATMGPERLADEVVLGGNINSIRIVDHNFQTVAYSVPPGADDLATDWTQVTTGQRGAIISGQSMTVQGDTELEVAAPIFDADGHVIGAVMVSLPTVRMQEALRDNLLVATLVAAAALAVGMIASVLIARWVTLPVVRLTEAAEAVEAGTCKPDSLDPVARRRDKLGHLARVFQDMAREVQMREQRLKAQVQELTIEIDRTREARQVAEITETDYFQELQAKARTLRARPAPGGTGD
jgi:HAMP domain-containing protein